MSKPSKKQRMRADAGLDDLTLDELGFWWTVWRKLSPAERFKRSWRMRRLLRDPERVHDEKIWPRP